MRDCLLSCVVDTIYVFFFKQKTAYEMRISDWSSDVCSSDLHDVAWQVHPLGERRGGEQRVEPVTALEQRFMEHALGLQQLRVMTGGAAIDLPLGVQFQIAVLRSADFLFDQLAPTGFLFGERDTPRGQQAAEMPYGRLCRDRSLD